MSVTGTHSHSRAGQRIANSQKNKSLFDSRILHFSAALRLFPIVSSHTPSSSYQAGGGAATRLQLAGDGAMPPKSDSVEGKSPLLPNPNQNGFGSKPFPILIVLSSLDQSSDNRCAPVSLFVSCRNRPRLRQ
jgi:hypothetical protein